MEARFGKLSDRLTGLERMRQTLGYRETLKRGYAVVRGRDGVVTTRSVAQGQSRLEIEFQDGRLELGGRPKRGAKPEDDDQGSLF
jgi:exodeoxyribonuclease VII large subunit